MDKRVKKHYETDLFNKIAGRTLKFLTFALHIITFLSGESDVDKTLQRQNVLMLYLIIEGANHQWQ